MVPYSDLSGYITCGETVEINSLDARIWLGNSTRRCREL